MSYDLDTPEGMDNAVEWTLKLLAQLKDGGTWAIPRSFTTVTIDRCTNTATVTSITPDPAIARVIRACGWRVVERAALEAMS